MYGLTILFKNGIFSSRPESWNLIFNAILPGLLAGIFEETARYLLFKNFLKQSHTWKDGIVVGLGHGGMEAILIGIFAIATLVNMIAFRDVTDLPTFGVPVGQMELVKTQVEAYRSQPDLMPLFGLVERISALSLPIGLSVIMLYSIVSGQRKWFWFALLGHVLVDALAVYLFPKVSARTNILLGVLGLEILIAVLGAGVLAYAIRLRSSFPVEKEAQGI